MSAQEWRDILVGAEAQGRAPSQASLEVIGKARELGDRLGARVLATWAGEAQDGQPLIHGGADELLVLEGEASPRALAATLRKLVEQRRPEILLLPATPEGSALAGRLAAALGTGALGSCIDLDLDESARLLVGKRAGFGGAITDAATIPQARPQIATLRPGAARAAWPDDGRSGRVTRIPLEAAPASTLQLVDTKPRGAPAVWRGSERLVVGGALLDAAGFEALQGLAGKLGAAWAGTRAAATLGLVPEDRALQPWDAFPAPKLCIVAGIEDPFELMVALPTPGELVVVGDGPLAKVARHVVPGEPGAVLAALADRVR